MNKDKVYVVMEDWKIDSGESDIYESVFSTFEKAMKYALHLKENYEQDFETKERKDEIYTNEENIIAESEIFDILVSFEDSADYYRIWIDKKNIDEEV